MKPGAPPRFRRALFLGTALLVGLCGAALVAGGLHLRARAPVPSDPALLPRMADRPVVLKSGVRLYVQRYEVSVAEWNRCHAAGACRLRLRVRSGWDPQTTPATGVSYIDVGEYVAWINQAAGWTFRLPTAAEWAWMAKDILPEKPDPIFTDPTLQWAADYLTEKAPSRILKPLGSNPKTAEGIADLTGSVWEWTQDCYTGESGTAAAKRCPAYYVGGEHVAVIPYLVRDPARGGCAVGSPPPHLGLRLVSDRPVPRS